MCTYRVCILYMIHIYCVSCMPHIFQSINMLWILKLFPSLAIMNTASQAKIQVLVLSTFGCIPSSRIPWSYVDYIWLWGLLFCVLILFSTTLLTLLALIDFLFCFCRFFRISSVKMDSFPYSFPSWMSLFLCLA